jgi:thymidylate kinase
MVIDVQARRRHHSLVKVYEIPALIGASGWITDTALRSQKECKLKAVILGPDGAGKSSVIRGLIDVLSHKGHMVKMRHLRPRLVTLRRGDSVTAVTDPHGKPPRSTLVSIAKITVWLMEEWFASLFLDRKNALLICDRYYHDLLVDPARYRYGGPEWVARSVARLMPQPDLWVLLDAPAEVLQARKREVPLEETCRQRDAYLSFIRNHRNFAVVDAAQPLDKVIADVEAAIIRSPNLSDGNRE